MMTPTVLKRYRNLKKEMRLNLRPEAIESKAKEVVELLNTPGLSYQDKATVRRKMRSYRRRARLSGAIPLAAGSADDYQSACQLPDGTKLNYMACGAMFTKKDKGKIIVKYCRKKAGQGTLHSGVGRCNRHGGMQETHLNFPDELRRRYENYLMDPKIMDLSNEIANVRFLVMELQKDLSTIGTEGQGGSSQKNSHLNTDGTKKTEAEKEIIRKLGLERVKLILDAIDVVGRTVERKHKIDVGEKHILEISGVTQITNQIIMVLDKYITDPEVKKNFVVELESLRFESGQDGKRN